MLSQHLYASTMLLWKQACLLVCMAHVLVVLCGGLCTKLLHGCYMCIMCVCVTLRVHYVCVVYVVCTLRAYIAYAVDHIYIYTNTNSCIFLVSNYSIVCR